MQWFRRKSDGEPAGSADGAADSAGSVPPATPIPAPAAIQVDVEQLRETIVERLRTVYDPEIPVNIYEIGLIYGIDIEPDGRVQIRMTLTSPMCPVAESLPIEVENKVAALPGVAGVGLELVWDPPWTPAMMSEEARLLLNIG